MQYNCKICNTGYERSELAKACEDSHKFVLVRFDREDLYKLLQFLITKDDSLLTESLMKTLRKYQRGSYGG